MDIFHRLYKNPYGLAAIRMAVAIAIICGVLALLFLLVNIAYAIGATATIIALGIVILIIFYIGLVYEAKQDLDIE